MGVSDLFFKLNYFEHKYPPGFDVIVAIATAVGSSFCDSSDIVSCHFSHFDFKQVIIVRKIISISENLYYLKKCKEPP